MDQSVIKQIGNELERLEEDAKYTSKGHFAQAATWGNAHIWIGVVGVLLAVTAGVVVFGGPSWIAALVSILALAAACLNALQTFLNPEQRSVTHKKYGAMFKGIRDRARMLRTIKLEAVTDDGNKIYEEVEALRHEYQDLNEAAPQISDRARKTARRGIEEGEAEYEVDQRSQ